MTGGILVVVVTGLWGSIFAADPTVVAGTEGGGFALYRSGWLKRGEVEDLCAAGVRQMLVLDGTGEERECGWRASACAELRVRFNGSQQPDRPLTAGFLRAFDRWIEESRTAGAKILFRCRHGWHRAGRLAAYYRLRHQGVDVEEAIREMNAVGRMMWRHRYLEPQVRALADYIAGRPCSVAEEHCVVAVDAGEMAFFPADACGDR